MNTDLNDVLFLKLTEDIMLKWILKWSKEGDRLDDNFEVAKKRFKTFYEESS